MRKKEFMSENEVLLKSEKTEYIEPVNKEIEEISSAAETAGLLMSLSYSDRLTLRPGQIAISEYEIHVRISAPLESHFKFEVPHHVVAELSQLGVDVPHECQ